MSTDARRLLWGNQDRAKWVVVAATFLVLFVVNGTVATYGVFITPIEAEFGWSRTTVSLTFTIYLLATATSGSPPRSRTPRPMCTSCPLTASSRTKTCTT